MRTLLLQYTRDEDPYDDINLFGDSLIDKDDLSIHDIEDIQDL